MTKQINIANCNEWLKANNPKSVAIVCNEGHGDIELAGAIKNYSRDTNVRLFEPGNFLKEDAAEFEFVLFGHVAQDQNLSMLRHGEFWL